MRVILAVVIVLNIIITLINIWAFDVTHNTAERMDRCERECYMDFDR